jgi:amino acid transporter
MELKRVISLPLLVLYGLGITIGAGIYVLIGAATAEAGAYAPSAFLFAAIVMAFSALSFAELSGRFPLSAGEAVYVDAGFGKNWLTLFTGLLIVSAATIAGAAISIGCAGYIGSLVPLPKSVIILVIILSMGFIATRGIKNSLIFAGALTVVEILGLIVIVGAGFIRQPEILTQLPTAFPSFSDTTALTGVLSASLVAFFAFIGFDDVVNLVEETQDPKRTMPLAIIISLIAVTVIYFFVVFVAVQSVPLEVLAQSTAPVGLLFTELTGLSPLAITFVAIVATINGVVIEIIMASRVMFGLSNKGRVPTVFGEVNARTRVPTNATMFITLVMLGLALFVPLDALVEWTSQAILFAFLLVNAALVMIKRRGEVAPAGIFTIPIVIPIVGFITCAFLLIAPNLV